MFGIGFIGEGKYNTYKDGQETKEYTKWRSMMNRCYSEAFHKKQPSYAGCSVCYEWYNFQNFAQWFHENYYKIDGEEIELDKDILIKGNKLYSPQTCCFVPHIINDIILKSDAKRGELPLGVHYDKNRNKFASQYNRLFNEKRKLIPLGRFDSIMEAFESYKFNKESYIKEVANDYKDRIPLKIYETIYNWKIEITD